jgi:hypothetical protein
MNDERRFFADITSLMDQKKTDDRWFRVLGIPVIAFMGHIIFFNRNDTGEERFGFWGIYLLSLAETLVLWEANRLVIMFIRKQFPSLLQTRQRILLMLLSCGVLTIIIRVINLFIYDRTMFWGYRFPLEAYLQGVSVALLFVVIVGGVYEAVYYFRMWKDMAVEAESLKKENLQTQLDSLKAQMSPHFLFNSLGSLSSLIEEDPRKAQTFVAEMSSVYRYLLQANDRELTTLRDEMEFIQAYMNMLGTRFPEGLQLEVDIADNAYEYLLPPLTIQILIENAVKHNAVMASRPLRIKINTDETPNLVVWNSVQKKTSPVPSHKKGLRNIIEKYRLLNQPGIVIEETPVDFRVTVPLIKKNHHAGTHR